MSYILNGTTIKSPTKIEESNNTQMAEKRVLSGAKSRDYFGSNKRVWKLTYHNVQKTYFDVLNTIYTNYLTTSTAVTWQSTETNYTISSTTVHVDIPDRAFTVGGEDYLSDFVVILTEA